MSLIKILIIVTRIGLGGLFLYGGVQKFVPKKERPAKVKQEVIKKQEGNNETKVIIEQEVKKSPESRIGPFIGGLKQTGYFWTLWG